MIAPIRALKRDARNGMKGQFLLFVIGACALIFSAVTIAIITEFFLLFQSTEALYIPIFFVLIFLAVIPIGLGVLRFFWLIYRGQKQNPSEIFYLFGDRKTYYRYLCVAFPIYLRSVIVFFLSQLPSLILNVLSNPEFYKKMKWTEPNATGVFSTLSVILSAVGWIVFLLYILRFYMAPFLFVASPQMTPRILSGYTEMFYRQTSRELLRYVLSFLPLILLSLLVVPLIFTLPYFMTGYLTYCRYAVARYNHSMAQTDCPKIDISVSKGGTTP